MTIFELQEKSFREQLKWTVAGCIDQANMAVWLFHGIPLPPQSEMDKVWEEKIAENKAARMEKDKNE